MNHRAQVQRPTQKQLKNLILSHLHIYNPRQFTILFTGNNDSINFIKLFNAVKIMVTLKMYK